MNSGVYFDMSRSEYDLLPRHNQSTLKKWMQFGSIPSEFAYWRSNNYKQEDKECFLIGDAFDCILLDPLNFEKRFVVSPICDKRTKIGQKVWEEFRETTNGRNVLTFDQLKLIREMVKSVNATKSVSDVFKYCEKAVILADLFGFPCKAEVDLWDGGKTEHIWDLKQLKDVSRKGFKKAFIDYGYDIQATFYLSLAMSLGIEKTVFSFICVKNVPPYTVRVHSFEPKAKPRHDLLYNICLSEIQTSLEELDRRIKSDDFKDDDDWESIDIPEWRLRTALDATRYASV